MHKITLVSFFGVQLFMYSCSYNSTRSLGSYWWPFLKSQSHMYSPKRYQDLSPGFALEIKLHNKNKTSLESYNSICRTYRHYFSAGVPSIIWSDYRQNIYKISFLPTRLQLGFPFLHFKLVCISKSWKWKLNTKTLKMLEPFWNVPFHKCRIKSW